MKRVLEQAKKESSPKRTKLVSKCVDVTFVNKSEPHALYAQISFVLNCGILTWKDVERLAQVSHSMRYFIKESATGKVFNLRKTRSDFYTQHGYYEFLCSGLITQIQYDSILPHETFKIPQWLKKCHEWNNWTPCKTLNEEIERFLNTSKKIHDGFHIDCIMFFNTNTRLSILRECNVHGYSLMKPIFESLNRRESPKFIRKLLEIHRNGGPNTLSFGGTIVYAKHRFDLNYICNVLDILGPYEMFKFIVVFRKCGFFAKHQGVSAILDRRLPLKYLGLLIENFKSREMLKIKLSERIMKASIEEMSSLSIQMLSDTTLQCLCELDCFKTEKCIDFVIQVMKAQGHRLTNLVIDQCPVRKIILVISMEKQISFLKLILKFVSKDLFIELICIVWRKLKMKDRKPFLKEFDQEQDVIKTLSTLDSLRYKRK